MKTIRAKRFTKGIVVYNHNNYTKAIVIDGYKGKDSDPSSLVLELGADGYILHTPPNRALEPTGEYFDLSVIESVLKLPKKEQSHDKGI